MEEQPLTALDWDELLAAVSRGEASARDRLVALIQGELRGIARRELAREHKRDPVLQTTLLVNEAYLKLFEGKPVEWQSRAHFFGAARRAMRQFLIDEARRRQSKKSGEGQTMITLGDWIPGSAGGLLDMLELDDALTRLARLDPRQAAVVEYKCLLGLSNEETARLLDVSLRTVVGDWTHAKAWLRVELQT